MAASSPSEEGQFAPENIVERSILQQAESAAAAQGPNRQEAPSEKVDLVNLDLAEETPPPAYGDICGDICGDIYGEIRDEENGLGTSARVTGDGRVNIRISQLSRRLSQIFTPALRQQVQSVDDSDGPPSPYVPPSLGGEKGVPPPPPLNIVIQVVGSRGDVQPFVALGKVLKYTYGHRVRLASHPNFKEFVQENGLEFFSIGGDPSRLMAFMAKNPSLMPGFRSLVSGDISQRRKDVAEYIQGCWRSCYKAGDGTSDHATDDDLTARPFVADCIIANPPSFAHIHCAEKLGIPLHIMFTMPYSPTQAFPHPLANIQSSNADPQLTNYISYVMIEVLQWQGLGDIINRFRAKCLSLDPVSLIWGPGMLHRLKVPHTYCWSPALIPKPKDWGPHISVSGYYSLESASHYTPTPDLQDFLEAGPTPIYIGFGSIVLEDPNGMMELVFEAVRKTSQRAILSKGWGGMGAGIDHMPSGIFMIGNVPHDWLFKHVSCVVHHGGAGTTASGIAAGRPTVVVPFFGDQAFWGAMIARAGAGPDPIHHKQLTADKLADAINFCLRPESLERAKNLASKTAAERGSDMGAQSFHQHLEIDRLRCMLAPSRPATWRIKRSQIRLSAFAACTLANAKLLDFHDLKLFRPQEYETDEGPWDPISGGAAACFRAFSGMAMGVAEFPSETLKPLHIPIGSRQQSQESLPIIARRSKTSLVNERSTSAGQNPSLNAQESLSRVGSLPSRSSSNIESSHISEGLGGQLNPKQEDAGRRRVRSRNEPDSGKDRDMLRQTGVHTSKGLGRIVKSSAKIPMDISVGLTKGFHNFPKLWGDDTVRPQEKISDFKSGVMAVGKEFGYGWYDGVTGLVTHPLNGARKDGAGGFLKGIGKGLGGFVTKPTAGFAGVLGHTMKGVHKEMQKLFGGNVQNYIIASRVAQGYEEWLQSSDTEKQDVLVRWKLVQKCLNERNTEEAMQDFLKVQKEENIENTEANSNSGVGPILDSESAIFTTDGSRPEELHEMAGTNEIKQLPGPELPRPDAEEDASLERWGQEDESQLQHRQQEATDSQTEDENLRQAIAASEIEAQRHASEALEFERQLEQVMAQSLREHNQRQSSSSSSSVWLSDASLDEDDEDIEREPDEMTGKVVATSSQQPPSYHPTMKSEFGGQRGEKTAEERTEEEIVLEYVKKQSLLEIHHRNKGKSRATAADYEGDEDDEDLQKALKLSMQDRT